MAGAVRTNEAAAPADATLDRLTRVASGLFGASAAVNFFDLVGVIDALASGAALFDCAGNLIHANTVFAATAGMAAAQLIEGTALRDLADTAFVSARPHVRASWREFCRGSLTLEANWSAVLDPTLAVRARRSPLPSGGCLLKLNNQMALRFHGGRRDRMVPLQQIIDAVPFNMWIKDAQSRFIVANAATARQVGFGHGQDLIGKTDADLHAPERAERFKAEERVIAETATPMIGHEEHVLTGDGEAVWVSSTKAPLIDSAGTVFGIVGVSQNITARKKAEQLRDGQAQILEMIATGAPLADVLDRLILVIEAQVEAVYGSVLLLDGLRLRLGSAPHLPAAYSRAIEGLAIGPSVGSCGSAAYRREPVIVADTWNDPRWAPYRALMVEHGLRSCWSTPILSQQGQVLGTFALYSRAVSSPGEEELALVDVATKIAGIAIERKLAEEQIQFMATHDALTGLPNRATLNDRLAQAMLLADRYDRCAAVAFCDLDNFKLINDSFGHNAGDELLRTAAKRMKAQLGPADVVMRIGGDEFVIVLSDLNKHFEATAKLNRVRDAIGEPLTFNGRVVRVSASLGVALYPNDGADAETLIANADAAMYRAKQAGRDNLQFYRPELTNRAREKLEMIEDLRQALVNDEFVLHYQPQVDLRTGAAFGVEALIRWNHPRLGRLSPGRFIPLAEEAGLIGAIGHWVLLAACRQIGDWAGAGVPPVRVSVNVSARQFNEGHLVEDVAAALAGAHVAPHLIELELTESMIMQDVEQAVATMKALARLGVELSIDDFGAGYSSLSALKTFPVARLKIDKTFIGGAPDDENDAAVASAVISLAQKMKLRVIAEGVETSAQLQFLRDNQCDEAQGYYLSRPLPAAECETFLRTWSGAI